MKKLVLFAFMAFLTQLVAAQTITAVGAPFNIGVPMVFDYTGGTGAATDWIGIYLPGEVPDGTPPSLTWDYISSPSGQFTFGIPLPNSGANGLPPGDYTAHLFCCDGYDIIASVNFSVVGTLPSEIYPNNFPLEGGTVSFTYAGGPGNSTDWIGIYDPGAVPGTDPSIMFQYTTGTEGELVFDIDGILSPGTYEAHFFCCDIYTILASTTFTVYEVLTPSLAPVGTLNETLPLTFAFTGGTGSLSDWVGIYPAGEVPDGDPSSIAYVYVGGANGEVTFDPIAELVEGNFYDAHLFCCDGYDILASYLNWTVVLSSTGEKVLQPAIFTASTPEQGMVRLSFQAAVNGDISVSNMAGQTVRSFAVDGKATMDVTGLQAGTYAVVFQDGQRSQPLKVVVR
jgi:acid phosphatase type 7